MELKFHVDIPVTLFTSLEERLNTSLDYAKEHINKDGLTPLDYYRWLQDDEKSGYRIKL